MSGRRLTWLLLGAIVALGFALRVYGITDKGFFYYDEAYFLLESKTFTEGLAELRAAASGGLDLAAVKDRLIEKGCVFPPGTARPSFNLIVTISALIFGLTDYCGFLPSVLFSSLAAWLGFLLARRVWNERTGLAAAFLIATSGFSIMYGRTGYGQTTAGFFLMAALYLYIRTLRPDVSGRAALAAGGALGFAVTCHYGVVLGAAALAAAELYFLLTRTAGRRLKTSALFAAGAAAPLLLYEALFRAVKLALGARLDGINYLTYFEQFAYVGGSAPRDLSPAALAVNDYLFYPRVLAAFDGPLLTALMLAAGFYALAKLFKRRTPAELVLFSQSYLMLAFWILNPGAVKGARILLIFYPLLLVFLARAFTAALGAVKAGERAHAALLAAALLATAAANAGTVASVITSRSNFRDAAEELKARGVNDAAVFINWPIWQFYMGHKLWANLDRITDEKSFLDYTSKKKIDHLILDFSTPLQDPSLAFLNRISAEKRPLLSWDTDTRSDILFRYEMGFLPQDLRRPRGDSPFHKIKCYRIADLGLGRRPRRGP